MIPSNKFVFWAGKTTFGREVTSSSACQEKYFYIYIRNRLFLFLTHLFHPCLLNQSDKFTLFFNALNPDSSAHLIGNLIIVGVDEHKLKLASERLSRPVDSSAFPLLCRN